MKKIFVSHCSNDSTLGERFVNFLIDSGMLPENITFSSNPNNGLGSGRLDDKLKEKIAESNIFILLVTKNYLRSYYCIAELSCAWYLNKAVIPIIFDNNDETKSVISSLTNNALAIDASDSKKRAESLYKMLFDGEDRRDRNKISELAETFFSDAEPSCPLRPYIGGTEDHENILLPCNNYGILAVKNGGIPESELSDLPICTEIYILSTTGANLMKGLSSGVLPAQLAGGCHVKILVPNAMSEFCKDVCRIENIGNNIHCATEDSYNFARITQEFKDVIHYSKESLKNAGSNASGKITIACAQTLLRQTITLFVYDSSRMNGKGFMSLTLPPSRTVEGSPGILFRSNGMSSSLFEIAKKHLDGIWAIANEEKELIDVGELSDDCTPAYFRLEKLSARKFWDEKCAVANKNAEYAKYEGNGILIEVAAQHPLIGNKPNKEFKARLDFVLKLYREAKLQCDTVVVYIPGSIHKNPGETDVISLSAAGSAYLKECGVDERDIRGEDWNKEFKGDDGVYNSADECYVTAQAFFKYNYSKVSVVCSPVQAMRKYLFYIYNGIFPQVFCIPSARMFHQITDEIFNSIECVLYKDHDWQDKNSERFLNSRKERG